MRVVLLVLILFWTVCKGSQSSESYSLQSALESSGSSISNGENWESFCLSESDDDCVSIPIWLFLSLKLTFRDISAKGLKMAIQFEDKPSPVGLYDLKCLKVHTDEEKDVKIPLYMGPEFLEEPCPPHKFRLAFSLAQVRASLSRAEDENQRKVIEAIENLYKHLKSPESFGNAIETLYSKWKPLMDKISPKGANLIGRAFNSLGKKAVPYSPILKIYCYLLVKSKECPVPSAAVFVELLHIINLVPDVDPVLYRLVYEEEFLGSLSTADFTLFESNKEKFPMDLLDALISQTFEKQDCAMLARWATCSISESKDLEKFSLFESTITRLKAKCDMQTWVPLVWDKIARLKFLVGSGDWNHSIGPCPAYFKRLFDIAPDAFSSHYLVDFEGVSSFLAFIIHLIGILELLSGNYDESTHITLLKKLAKFGRRISEYYFAVSDYFLTITYYDFTTPLSPGIIEVRNVLEHASFFLPFRILPFLVSVKFHHVLSLWLTQYKGKEVEAQELLSSLSNSIDDYRCLSVLLKHLHRKVPKVGNWVDSFKKKLSPGIKLILKTILKSFYEYRDTLPPPSDNNEVSLTIHEDLLSLDTASALRVWRALAYLLFDVPFDDTKVVDDTFVGDGGFDPRDFEYLLNFWVESSAKRLKKDSHPPRRYLVTNLKRKPLQ